MEAAHGGKMKVRRGNKKHVPYAGAAAAAGLYPYGVPKPVDERLEGLFHSITGLIPS